MELRRGHGKSAIRHPTTRSDGDKSVLAHPPASHYQCSTNATDASAEQLGV